MLLSVDYGQIDLTTRLSVCLFLCVLIDYTINHEQFLRMVGNKSVYNEYELKEKYDTWKSLTLIELLYYGYFGEGNNVNWVWLKNHGCWPDGVHPMNFRYTRDQFEKILREGKVNVGNVIIN